MAEDSVGYEGWLRLWRKSLKSAVFQDAHLWHLWSYLMMCANYEERQLLDGRKLKRGQLVISLQQVADRLGVPHKSTIQRRLKKLEELGNIATHSATTGTLVTVRQWPTYNPTPDEDATRTQRGRNADATRTQRGRNADATRTQPEEVKKGRREEVNSLSPSATEKKETDLLEREAKFITTWNKLEGVLPNTRPALSQKRRVMFRARLKDQDWAADCAAAFKTKFPLKQFLGKSGWQPNIEWILRPDVVMSVLEGKYDRSLDGEAEIEPLDIAGALARTRKDGDD